MKSSSNEPRLGIDIGRVIITPGDGNADTSFIGSNHEAALRTPPMPNAFEFIGMLRCLFNGAAQPGTNLFLVSKCGKRIQQRSLFWLDKHDFWTKTQIPRSNIRFCRKRHEKAPICEELGITYFVDDRVDCLAPMEGIVPHRYLFGPQKPRTRVPPGVVPVEDWTAAYVAIANTFNDEAKETA